jgi:hypothetical protein
LPEYLHAYLFLFMFCDWIYFFLLLLHSKHMLNSVNFSMAHNGKKILATTEHYILISLWSPTFSWNDYMLVCRNHLISRI